MKPSPLDLRHYFVTHASMSANPDFDAAKPVALERDDVQIDCDVRQMPEAGQGGWVILLNVRQNVGPEKNAPYNFAVKITGFFQVHPRWPDDPERLVRTNGPTMLFGACREIIRAMTAQGPFEALVIPSVSFYTPESPRQEVADAKSKPLPPVRRPRKAAPRPKAAGRASRNKPAR